jgi:hypothetical protein
MGDSRKIVLKQFRVSKERPSFEQELKLLKKIKSLEMPNNGGFPLILSAKVSKNFGEILMTYQGSDLYEILHIQ